MKLFIFLDVRLLFQSLGTFVPSCCLIILACVQLDSYSTLALMVWLINSIPMLLLFAHFATFFFLFIPY